MNMQRTTLKHIPDARRARAGGKRSTLGTFRTAPLVNAARHRKINGCLGKSRQAFRNTGGFMVGGKDRGNETTCCFTPEGALPLSAEVTATMDGDNRRQPATKTGSSSSSYRFDLTGDGHFNKLAINW
ncbi:hypothetical protein ElyMa_003317400 [Elysia marginata]|uniref:Uncharacterized protein n=1 Tax=Elysia marginata TaxID=1093978 RepID=A0AAV4JE44_9GAST|nr:hypothetical protein ElyMa_003317400 [Elysia marginata]